MGRQAQADMPRGVAWGFYARVEQLRCQMEMPTTELARISGVRRQTFLELKRTTRRPRRDIVLKLASAVGLDTGQALSLAGLSPVDSDTVRRTIAEAHDLTHEQKESLYALLTVYDENDQHAVPAPAQAAARRGLNIARVA